MASKGGIGASGLWTRGAVLSAVGLSIVAALLIAAAPASSAPELVHEAGGAVRCFGVDGVALSPPSWSSDGSMIAVDDYETHGVRIVSVATGSVEEFGVPLWNSPAFGPHGSELVVEDGADRRIRRLIFDPSGRVSDRTLPYAHLFRHSWSPDGTKLVVAPVQRDGGRGAAIMNIANGEITPLFDEGDGRLSVGDAVWERLGKQIVLAQFEATKTIDVASRSVKSVLPVGLRDLAVGGDGTVYGISYEVQDQLVSWDREEYRPEVVAEGIASFSLEPSGPRIAVERRGQGLFTLSLVPREEKLLTSDTSDRLASWSPTGGSIAFLRLVDGSRRLCTVTLPDGPR